MIHNLTFPKFLKNLTLSKPQHAFLMSGALRKILNCGRYGGKTFLALLDILLTAFRLWATRRADPNYWRPGPLVTIGLFAPTERQFMILWKLVIDLLPAIPGKAPDGYDNVHPIRSEGRIFIFGELGIQIDFVSLWDCDTLRGDGYDIVFLDEAAMLKKPNFFFAQIVPLCIRAGYYGKIILASTPRNNFWDRWFQNATLHLDRFRRYEAHWWTSFHNPRLTADQMEEILDDRAHNPNLYRREYLAELFVDVPDEAVLEEGEVVWDTNQIERCFVRDLIDCSEGPFTAAFDIAWKGNEEAVLSIAHDPTAFVCHMEVFPTTSDMDLVDIMKRADTQWGHPPIYYDRTGSRARSFSEFIPKRINAKPLILRRSIDRNLKADYVVSKDYLVRATNHRMTMDRIHYPDPDTYPMERLPYHGQQDQEKNFRKLYRQMGGYRRKTIRNRLGDEEHFYFPAPTLNPDTARYETLSDCVESVILLIKGLPAIIQEPGDLKDLENEMFSNW